MRLPLVFLACLVAASLAQAQDRGVLNPKPLPPIANPDAPGVPAKELFGRAREGAPLEARSLGF